VFPAGFHDFSGEALSDFDRFGNTAALGHQSRNVRAGTQIAAILQILNANANGHFFDFREVLLPLHGRFLRRHYSKDTGTGLGMMTPKANTKKKQVRSFAQAKLAKDFLMGNAFPAV
jgi:hypothetical protein